jgi:hypothetical protein
MFHTIQIFYIFKRKIFMLILSSIINVNVGVTKERERERESLRILYNNTIMSQIHLDELRLALLQVYICVMAK